MNDLCMGWVPDLPDFRDFNASSSAIKSLINKTRKNKDIVNLVDSVDLSEWCSVVEDQGKIGSCTANAGVALIEYFEKRANGKYIDASRLFLYKTTRKLMGLKGDTGAYLRDTMKAMSLFGVPPTKYYPYDIDKFDDEPEPFHYALAQNYQALKYYRLDPPGTSRTKLLHSIKLNLSLGLPAMFGFTVFSSLNRPNKPGEIAFPDFKERILGGHAVVAVGYDDSREIKNTFNGNVTIGALKIRNSWGSQWGEDGYGWLPYDYVKLGLAKDWWTLISNEWIDTGVFN
jgi:C1A family cysteine protease